MHHHDVRREEGQVVLALLLVVVAVLFLTLVFGQVGSAADQKTQARTAADAAAVAAAQSLRDARISAFSRGVPHAWATTVFAGEPAVPDRASSAACAAAQRNWQSNPHRSNPHRSSFSCASDLEVQRVGSGIRAAVRTPAGQVAPGPADASGVRFEATATVRVVLDRCPPGLGARAALTRWLVDRTVVSFGAFSRCYTPADEVVLRKLDLKPWQARGQVGEPRGLLVAVRNATHVEIVQ